MRNTYAENTMGIRIREMRKAAGMSQEQLAEILCTKKATISAYENDHIDIKKQHCSRNSKSPELQWIISAGREKGRGTGCQNNGCVAGTEK